MLKPAIAAFLTILLLTSGGCNRTPVVKNAEDKGRLIIEYKDAAVYEDDVIKKMNYYVIPRGMSIKDLSEGEDKEIWKRFKKDIIFELSFFQIALEQAEQLGLYDLSPAEKRIIDDTYSKGLEVSRIAVKKADQTTGGNEGISENSADFTRKLDEYLYLHGYDLETYKLALEQEYIVDKVKNHFTKDISVTDEEVRTIFENALEVQKSNSEKKPDSIEQQLLFGTDVLYYPEGYMYAKHILIGFDSEDSGSAAIAYVNGDIDEYNKIVKESVPKIQQRVDMILKKLNDGADFDDLMVQYSDDKGLNEEPYRTRGFLIGPYSTFDLSEYLTALRTLKTAGDYSDPVTTYLGIYIIKCEKMLAGPVAFEEVKDLYRQNIIDQRKAFAWSAIGENWINDAISDGTLKQYPDRF